MRQAIGRAWALGLGVAGVLGLAGCYGVSTSPKVAPSTAQYRFEQELVDKAELVRESTQPESPRGRYAFRRGADRLLVLTRITSFLERKASDQAASAASGKRYDANMERAWITIPLDAQVGQPLRMEILEHEFRVGYDVDKANSGFFIWPVRVDGTVTIREQKGDAVVLDVDVRVHPHELEPWNVRGQFEMIPTMTGVRAMMLSASAQTLSTLRHGGETAAPAPAASQPAATQPAATQPANTQPSTTQPMW